MIRTPADWIMMPDKILLSIAFLCACNTLVFGSDTLSPSFRFWYSADGNHWADGQLQAVSAESDGTLAVVLKRQSGSVTQPIRVDRLSEADRAYVGSAMRLRSALASFSKSEFVGASGELEKVRAGIRARAPYYRGMSDEFLAIELMQVSRVRARLGESPTHFQDSAPRLKHAVFNNNHAQFLVEEVRFSDSYAGIESVTVVTDDGKAFNLGPGDISELRLLPDWLPSPRYRVPQPVSSHSVLLSMRAPREYPNDEGYALRPDPGRKVWTTALESQAYVDLDASARLWFDALELERPYAVRRLVKIGDQFCDARHFSNANRAYREAIRIGKPRPEISLRLAYAEFGMGLDSKGAARRAHYNRAKAINDEVSASAESSSTVLLASRYLGAWILAGTGTESEDDAAAFGYFRQSLATATEVGANLTHALSSTDVSTAIAPALRVFLLAETNGLEELRKLAFSNMEARCNRRLTSSVDRWGAVRKLPQFSDYMDIVKELEFVRSISFDQAIVDWPARDMTIRLSSEAAHYAMSATKCHELHQAAIAQEKELAELLPAEVNCDNYLSAKGLSRVAEKVAGFLKSEQDSSGLAVLLQKRGREDLCMWLRRSLQSATDLRLGIEEKLKSSTLNEIPHEQWSLAAFRRQEDFLSQVRVSIDSLGTLESETRICQKYGRGYTYPGQSEDIVDIELVPEAPIVEQEFLKLSAGVHYLFSAFWSEQDQYFDALYFLTRSVNTKNQLSALESKIPSDR